MSACNHSNWKILWSITSTHNIQAFENIPASFALRPSSAAEIVSWFLQRWKWFINAFLRLFSSKTYASLRTGKSSRAERVGWEKTAEWSTEKKARKWLTKLELKFLPSCRKFIWELLQWHWIWLLIFLIKKSRAYGDLIELVEFKMRSKWKTSRHSR